MMDEHETSIDKLVGRIAVYMDVRLPPERVCAIFNRILEEVELQNSITYIGHGIYRVNQLRY